MDEIVDTRGELPVTIVVCPEKKDVLLSRNQHRAKRHDGNQELERMINLHHQDFKSFPSRSLHREKIVEDVIEAISVSW